MQALKNTSPRFFPLNSRRTTSNDPAVNLARDTLNQAGEKVKNKSNTLFDSVFLNKRQVPQLQAAGPLAAFRTADAISLLTQRSQYQKIPIVDDLDKKESFASARLRELEDLTESLNKLKKTVDDLLLENVLNPKSASSSRFREVLAVPGKNAPLDSFDVKPIRLSQNAELASDVKDPSARLGLTGSFSINGVSVTVDETDSLVTIRNKINFGEDSNRNGILDPSEDVNGNGSLDILQISNSEYGGGVFIKEDVNENGKIDPTEDSNGNKRLDGGTSDNNVLALVRDNRLVLVSLAGGSNTIDISEDNNVLLELGFFEVDGSGKKVQKEIQLNDLERPDNLVVQPQTALTEVDGDLFSSDSNILTGSIEHTALLLKKTSNTASKITIFIDVPVFFEQIKILLNQFNDSISKVNDLLSVNRIFENDGDIQDIRNDLTIEPQKRVRVLEERNRVIEDLLGRRGNPQAIGLSVTNTSKDNIQEIAVTSIIQLIEKGLAFPSQNGDQNLLKRLSSIGIRTLNDNTFALDKTKFKRGLEKNTQEVFDLFTNSETGILTLLSENLQKIIRENRGDLAIKKNKVLIRSETNKVLSEKFAKFVDIYNLESTVQKLITVV